MVDKVGLGLVGRRRGDDVPVALVGAERLGVAPPLASGRHAVRLRRHHVPQGVVQISVQQTALVLGRRRRAVVAVGRVRHGEHAALLLQRTLVGRWPAKICLADGRLQGTLFICSGGGNITGTCFIHTWILKTLQTSVNQNRRPCTVWVAVVAAHAQPLSVALDVFVVQLDPQCPAQVGLSYGVLQPPPGVCKPVGDLRRCSLVIVTSQTHTPLHHHTTTHLHQCHVWAQGQQHLLRLGGVGVVPVFVQPMFQRPGHVLQHLSLVANFDSTQARPGGIRGSLIESPRPETHSLTF